MSAKNDKINCKIDVGQRDAPHFSDGIHAGQMYSLKSAAEVIVVDAAAKDSNS